MWAADCRNSVGDIYDQLHCLDPEDLVEAPLRVHSSILAQIVSQAVHQVGLVAVPSVDQGGDPLAFQV